MPRVLLLGGTGAMGVYLKEELLLLGYEVFITSRQKRNVPDGHISYIQGDGHDNGFLSRVLQQVRPDAVVDFMIYTTEEFRSRVDLLLSGTCHYVFVSSYRVFNEAKIIVESSSRLLDSVHDVDYLRTDEYALCKARCEDVLRSLKVKHWTIVRPSITYSKLRFQYGCLEANTLCYRAFRGLPVVIPGKMLDKQATMTWGGMSHE